MQIAVTKNVLLRILRSPILHFVLVGALLFGIAVRFDRGRPDGPRGAGGGASGAADAADAATIRVERDDLIAYIQSRTRMARAEEAKSAFDSATPAVRQDWIDRYVREEALVREARSLGLDRDDELVRRRLVQQMEFLVEGVGADGIRVSEEEVAAAYRERAEEFREPMTVRFAHVFVRVEKGREAEADTRAQALLERLNREKVGFDQALAEGDRFLYDRIYVDRTLDEVRSHFGDAMATVIEKMPVDPARWSGPVRSEHGLHLVLMTSKRESRWPTLEEITPLLRGEILREKRDLAMERGVAAIVAKYGVALEGGLADASPARASR